MIKENVRFAYIHGLILWLIILVIIISVETPSVTESGLPCSDITEGANE